MFTLITRGEVDTECLGRNPRSRSTDMSSVLSNRIYSYGFSFLYVYTDELRQMVSQTAGENLRVGSVHHTVITNYNFACNILKAQSSPVIKDLHMGDLLLVM